MEYKLNFKEFENDQGIEKKKKSSTQSQAFLINPLAYFKIFSFLKCQCIFAYIHTCTHQVVQHFQFVSYLKNIHLFHKTWKYIKINYKSPRGIHCYHGHYFLVIVHILKCSEIYSDSILASKNSGIWSSLALLIWVLIKYLLRFVTECAYLLTIMELRTSEAIWTENVKISHSPLLIISMHEK